MFRAHGLLHRRPGVPRKDHLRACGKNAVAKAGIEPAAACGAFERLKITDPLRAHSAQSSLGKIPEITFSRSVDSSLLRPAMARSISGSHTLIALKPALSPVWKMMGRPWVRPINRP